MTVILCRKDCVSAKIPEKMTEYQADQCLELLSRKLRQKGNITSREIFQLLGYQIKKVAGCIGVNVFPAYQSKGMSSPAARH